MTAQSHTDRFIFEIMKARGSETHSLLITEFVSVITRSPVVTWTVYHPLGFGIVQIAGTLETGPSTAGSDSA